MSRRKYTKLSELTASEGLERFRRNDSLVHRKLLSYLPFMIATNLATLLLSTVDGVVVGNLVGSEALSAVSIFMPITFVISIVCTWVASGISTALSTGMGDNRIEDLAPLKKAAVTVIGYATLPVFAFLLSHLYAPLFWLAYLAAESLLFLINAAHYAFCVSTDMQSEVPEEAVLYLTVPPEDAIEASQCVRRYAEVHGYPKRLAYRAALCMEEMIHYAVSANGGRDIRNQLMIKFFPDSCIFTIMDDGRCIMLDEDEETKELITNNSMIRKTVSSVKYQYILNLNYTVFCFA